LLCKNRKKNLYKSSVYDEISVEKNGSFGFLKRWLECWAKTKCAICAAAKN
jgi:hypothetical protein